MRRKSVIALALMGALTLATTPAIAKPKPTLAEIEAAKVAEAAKKKAADAAAKRLAAASLKSSFGWWALFQLLSLFG